MSNDIEIHSPYGDDHDDEMPGMGSSPPDDTILVEAVPRARVREAHGPAHETGHLVMAQLFGREDFRDDCSRGEDAHEQLSLEYDSCATAEGWADYVAIRAWYDPDNPSVEPFLYHYDIESDLLRCPVSEAGPTYTCHGDDWAHTQLAVTRAFWDIDDAHGEDSYVAEPEDGIHDSLNYSTTMLAEKWLLFPDGEDDRENDEDNPNGVNMKDWAYHSPHGYPTVIELNCLDDQED